MKAKRNSYSLDNRGRGFHSVDKSRDNKNVNEIVVKGFKNSRAKELDLLNAQGPHSIPERHYPQTVKALPWPPENTERIATTNEKEENDK